MKNNKRLEERRSSISADVDMAVRQSFEIVDRIHEILVRQGKGRKDLALQLGKSESEISKWMSGSHNFTIQTLATIQVALGESVIEVTREKEVEKTQVSYIGTVFPLCKQSRTINDLLHKILNFFFRGLI